MPLVPSLIGMAFTALGVVGVTIGIAGRKPVPLIGGAVVLVASVAFLLIEQYLQT